jgi:hypothetical protein
MVSAKSLFFSHSLIFVAGFAAGKLMDKEELDHYRSLHETTSGKIKKTAGKIALGMLLMASFVVGARMARAKPS